MQAAFGLLHSRPASLAPGSRARAVRAADRVVAARMQFVDGEVALGDVRCNVVVGPVRERVRLPELVTLVPAELGSGRTGRRLRAADARDPAVQAFKCASEWLDLSNRTAEVRVSLPERLSVQRRLPPERRAFVHLDPGL